jgi:hypothetical protein
MDASGHRFRAIVFATSLAIGAAGACGGAVSTPLDRPAPLQVGDDETAAPVPEASSSSSGGHKDATVPEEASKGKDMTMDASDEPVDDAESSEAEAGPDGGRCGMCMFPMRCCMTPGAMYYGQCYNQFLCATCCL